MDHWSENIDANGKRTVRMGRFVAMSPGKYGERDWKCVLEAAADTMTIAPTAAEMIALLGMMSLAQWRVFKEPARSALWLGSYAEDVTKSRTVKEVMLKAETCALNWELHRAWTRQR